MAEKLSMEEFFERARKGEFLGSEVTVIPKAVTFTVELSGLDGDPWEPGGGEWYVSDDRVGVYEGYTKHVDHLLVEPPKDGA